MRGTAINAGNPLNAAGAITEDSLSDSDTNAVYGEFKWRAADPLTLTLNARYDDITAKYKSYIPLSAAQVAAGRTATVGLVSIAAKRTAAVKTAIRQGYSSAHFKGARDAKKSCCKRLMGYIINIYQMRGQS